MPAGRDRLPAAPGVRTQVKARTPEPHTLRLLDAWLVAAGDCGVPDVTTFAAGLRREYAALRAALTLTWRTSPVEGQITCPKRIKRQGYGRSGPDAHKRRFLPAA